MLPLRPYQDEGMGKLESFLDAGGQRPLLAWATGLGKTILFGHWIVRRGGRALVIAHRDELLTQAAEKIRLIEPEAEIGVVKAEQHEPWAPIVVASIQTLARSPHRLAEIVAPGLNSIVVDEAHHSEAPSYQHTLQLIRCATDAPVLGVTATPARGDHRPLGKTWEKIVHSISILQGIQAGYLCDLKAERVRLNVNLNDVHIVKGDFVQDELEHVLLNADAPTKVAQAIAERAAERKTLCFTSGIETAYQTADRLRGLGIQAAAVHGEVKQADRTMLLQKFREGKIKAICNCNVLTEGFDEPTIDCVTIARPTRSQPFYAQMVGRGTRVSPGKVDCLVLDCVDAAFAHELVTLAELFALEAGKAFADCIAGGASVSEALAAVDEGKLHIESVPLLRHQFAWVKAGPVWCLGIGSGWLQLIEMGAAWHVEEMNRTGFVKTHWQGPSLEYAQGMAEDIMRSRGAQSLTDLQAGWRRAPMSEGQKQALRKWGVPVDPRMRKGEASDLLMRLIAGKAARQRQRVG